jgi:hypothetical protein
MSTTIAPKTVDLTEYDDAVNQPAPEGFTFNFRAYIECQAISWAGPVASTANECLNIIFEWDPSVTRSSRCGSSMPHLAPPSMPFSPPPTRAEP